MNLKEILNMILGMVIDIGLLFSAFILGMGY